MRDDQMHRKRIEQPPEEPSNEPPQVSWAALILFVMVASTAVHALAFLGKMAMH